MTREQDVMLRKEKAGDAAKKGRAESIKYEVQGEDILLLNGPYYGQRVKELWDRSAVERDYIVKTLWFSGDVNIVKIINSLTCQ